MIDESDADVRFADLKVACPSPELWYLQCGELAFSVLSLASDFDRRIVKVTESFPFILAWMVSSDAQDECPFRATLARRLLSVRTPRCGCGRACGVWHTVWLGVSPLKILIRVCALLGCLACST